jgi:hypothetical protein
MSVYGLYQYDDTLFEELALPEGIDSETVINNILLDSMELETFIPDPAALKTAIGYWSRAQLSVWQHLKETTEYEYNPIWNKDGEVTETETRNLAGSKSNTQTRNLSGTSGDTETRNLAGSGDTTTKNGVNAFNGSGYADRDQSITNASTTDTGTVQHSGSTSDTGTVQDSGQSTDTGTISRSRIEKGNIGVTTTQQMIKEEREIAEFNLVNYIVRSFIERFCLLVY